MTLLVHGDGEIRPRPRVGGPGGLLVLGRRHVDADRAAATQLRDGGLGVRHRFAVRALGVLHGPHTLALAGAREHRGGSVALRGLGVGGVDLVHVVAVDLDGVPAERGDPAGVGGGVPAVPGGPALAEAVHVHDRRQVAQPLVPRELERLPHRALGQFAVTAQHPDPEVPAVEPQARQRDPGADAEALPERSRRDVHPRQRGRRVALQPAPGGPIPAQLLRRHRTGRDVHRVQQRCGVPLREEEVVVGGVLGGLEVVTQVPGQQHGHQIRRRQRRRGVAGPGVVRRPHRVHAELPAQRRKHVVIHRGDGHGCRIPAAGAPEPGPRPRREPDRAPATLFRGGLAERPKAHDWKSCWV